jgi:uncharacterized protein YjiK
MRLNALRAVTATAAATLAMAAQAQWAGISSYQLVGNYTLPEFSPNPFSAAQYEASGVTWNRDTNTLFIVGDGGGFVMQTTLTGQPIDFMRLAAGSSPQGNEFYDPEGLTYIGGGQFVMTEERYRTVVRFTYAPGTTLQRSQTSTVKLATTVGNTGLEGVTFDPLTNGYILVNERDGTGGSLQNIFLTQVDFAAGTASNGSATTVNNTPLFPVGNIGYPSLHDVYALSNVYGPEVSGSSNLLALTLTGVREMTRSGVIVGSLSLPGAGYQVEGMTMDANGFLYLVSDNGDTGTFSALLVYAPVPEPATAWLLAAGGLLVAGAARRRTQRN